MPKLHVVVGSTRPGRLGLPIGQWAAQAAKEHAGFDVELADLAELGLPLLDEPGHPRAGLYAHEHTRRWSATVDEADAFVFVTPEYNSGPPAALLNALSFLYGEWLYKPVGFVSYGGVAAGLRSVQVLKQVATALKMMPIPESVAIPFVFKHMGEGGFRTDAPLEAAATMMLDELLRWTEALRPLRLNPPPAPAAPPAPGAPVSRV
ncbi:NADPH-dependent FMN reductase [Streptomyces pseudovenezuelae]|uniref:NAD(P)H-dependent FMN reductase n=1 Tax=Streptomyces pseudovenezuelae TaxID=67350 RepID=A0ABT6LTD0_9ACTN|nr:NAD(P)H-dependent oxidoreductase [Streptomyces pseudovenezuelae]MDH6219556.1 NAD(P)H-dependent FMN reductase [Streptomyces pseudovenezuelae]